MVKRKQTTGFTLIEMAIAMVSMFIIMLTIGFIMRDTQRGWSKLWNRMHSNVTLQSRLAGATFDNIIRKASKENVSIDANQKWVQVEYYNNDASLEPDRYARFYISNDELYVEYGTLDPYEAIHTDLLCENVEFCDFKQSNESILMTLLVTDENYHKLISTAAVMHNQ